MSNLRTISSKLWAIANELRGNMDAAEYKNYILAFMFYRYLSDHQEQYLVNNNVIDVKAGQSINQAYLEQANEDDLSDYLEDISSSLGYAIAPHDTWRSLIHKIDNSMVVPSDYQTIFDNFNKNAELNKESSHDFRGVFNDANLGDSRLGSSTNERAKPLNRIVKLVDEVDYKSDDGKDILGAIYEYLIGQFAASAGKKGGEFYTPREVSEILSKIVTLNKAKSEAFFNVYDPTMGSGSLLLTVAQELPIGQPIKFYGQELNTTTYNLARMNLMMHGVSFNNMTLSNADTLESDWPDGKDGKGIDRPRSFDAVVANPPYSAHWDNSETKLKDPRFQNYGKLAPKKMADYAFILHSLYHLNDEGTMAIVLPLGVLFRGGVEGTIRQIIIEKNYLDAVIRLPDKIFYGTSIYTTVLVFKKNRRTKNILFIDASGEFEKMKNQNRLKPENIEKIVETYKKREDVEKYAHVASLNEIKANNFYLNILRYVDSLEQEKEIDLAEIKMRIDQDKGEIAELEATIAEQLKILGV
jgi:type I restriction enzyme M protein